MVESIGLYLREKGNDSCRYNSTVSTPIVNL